MIKPIARTWPGGGKNSIYPNRREKRSPWFGTPEGGPDFSVRLLCRDCFPDLSIIAVFRFYWLFLLPLGSAALTPIGLPPAESPPHKQDTGSGARSRASPALALGWGKAVAEKEEEKEEEPGGQEAAAAIALG